MQYGKNLQFAAFLLLVGLILVFMKLTALEHRMKHMERHQQHCLTQDEYMTSFDNLLDVKLKAVPDVRLKQISTEKNI